MIQIILTLSALLSTFNTNIETKKEVQILEGYTTQINFSGTGGVYIDNLENIIIKPTGKFKELKLVLTADTQVLGGKQIKIPESYYIMFDMGNSKTPRVLYSSRIAENRLDTKDIGIFNGLKNPQSLNFNLKNSYLAKSSKEGIGKIDINFVEILNKNSGLEVHVSLYIGDGRSLIEEDINKRIFAIIEKAYFQYSCEDSSDCKIEVLK